MRKMILAISLSLIAPQISFANCEGDTCIDVSADEKTNEVVVTVKKGKPVVQLQQNLSLVLQQRFANYGFHGFPNLKRSTSRRFALAISQRPSPELNPLLVPKFQIR